MCLMFFLERPQMTVCNESSSSMASTLRLSSLSMKTKTRVFACSALSISPYIATLHL